LVISTAALDGTAQGVGPFAAESLNQGLYLLWVFLGVMMLTAFLFAAVLGERQEAERALVKSESTLRAFYDSAPVMMGVLELYDDDVRFVFCNRAVGEFLDRPVDPLAGELLSHLTTKERLELWLEHCRESAVTGLPNRFELMRANAEGNRILSAVVGPVRSEPGTASRFSFVVQDVTEHRNAEIERDRFFTHSLDMLCIADFGGRIKRVNAAFCQAMGYTAEEIERLDFEALFHSDDLPAAQAKLASLGAGSRVASFETRLRRKSGDHFWSLWAGTPDPERHVIYAVGKDISEKKEAEHALVAAKEAADAATSAKSQFLANVTHELRTLLSGIIGMAGLLRTTRLSEQQLEYVEAVNQSADSLLTLVNGLLDFSKIEARKLRLELECFSLRSMVGSTMRLLAPQAHQKGLELAYRVLPTVPDGLIGDQERLRQILVNLVGNAIKFTEKGDVVLQVSRQARGSDQDPRLEIGFRVSDTGIGIAPSKQDAIFGAFVQADGSTTRKYGGTGLGLAISVELAELMGGRIWVASKPGQGSTFHFTALLWPQEPGREEWDEPVPRQFEDRRVLVVDDSEVSREILVAQLRDWRMEPISVATGPAALSALKRARDEGRPFDLMLLDTLPGLEVGKYLKEIQEEIGSSVPSILMISGESRRAPGARELGVMGELTKPIQPSHLRRAVELLLQGQALESEEVVSTGSFRRPPRGNLQVLLAEDEPVNRTVTTSILAQAGHRVVAAENGRQAVEAHKRELFDIVLMDVQMPELDGLEATAAIRSGEVGTKRRVPIVALTARLLDEDKEACLRAGMDEFLSKPVDPDELCSLLDRLGLSMEADASRPRSRQVHARSGAALDRYALLHRTEGDVALATELARIFLEDCPKSMEELETSVRAREMDRLQRVLHRLSGSLEAMGAWPASAAVRRLREAALGGSSDLESTLGALQGEMQRLVVELASLVKENAVP
jgi:PAS domain S-box-containing protein